MEATANTAPPPPALPAVLETFVQGQAYERGNEAGMDEVDAIAHGLRLDLRATAQYIAALEAVIAAARLLPRYEVDYYPSGCDCCSPGVEAVACSYGDYVKWEQLDACLSHTPKAVHDVR